MSRELPGRTGDHWNTAPAGEQVDDQSSPEGELEPPPRLNRRQRRSIKRAARRRTA